MTLLQLQYFQTLAHTLHYTKTAEELHISQPSLSYAISGLESELGVKLFEKRNKKTELTLFGQQFLPYVENALSSLEDGKVVLEKLNKNASQIVHMGYFQSISSSLIPAIMERFYENPENREIRFDFVEEPGFDIFTKIRKGELDLGFCLHTADWAESVLIHRQPLYLAVPADHPLAGRMSVSLTDFADEPIIMLDQSSILRQQLDRNFAEINKVPNIVFEVRECNAALQYVNLKFGVSVLPTVHLAESDKVVFIPISDEDREYVRSIYLTRAKGKMLSVAAQKVWDHIATNFALPKTRE